MLDAVLNSAAVSLRGVAPIVLRYEPPPIIASTDAFRPYNPNPAELFRMYLGMLHEGGLSKGEVNQVASINPARLMGMA